MYINEGILASNQENICTLEKAGARMMSGVLNGGARISMPLVQMYSPWTGTYWYIVWILEHMMS